MRHRNKSNHLSRTGSHKRCMLANMLKSLIDNERIETTVTKAKVLKAYADKMVTLAKKGTIDSRRRAKAKLMIRYNKLTPKERRAAKNGDASAYNLDRTIEQKLFGELKTRFEGRAGGYTRIIKLPTPRIGDNSSMCIIEYIR